MKAARFATIEKVLPIRAIDRAYGDPDNSVDLFDYNRKNEYGDAYCVAAGILLSQVEEYWNAYRNESN